MHGPGNQTPLVLSDSFESLWSSPLPNPQRQLELFVLLLGNANLPLSISVQLALDQVCAEVGTTDDPLKRDYGQLNWVLKYLAEARLVLCSLDLHQRTFSGSLTIDGWARYERLKREVVESRTAFMAMAYSNKTLAGIAKDHFVPAVRETGFELFRLDDRPQPGIIDTRMRVEIRTAKFLICDLTDDNRGAYWEAGFAEGLGRPVFYTCEDSKFEKAKTHFDTEHLYTVRWSADKPADAAAELKAAIRNAFPAEATMPDRAEGRS
jgi:hypothetical protein